MSHRDPTLPRPDTDVLPESDLIARVKNEQDSNALLALVNRHTGMYFSVVNRYAASYPNAVRVRDLDDDKLFNFYTFILAFDPSRGMKLSTYIGDRTDYLCKTLLKRDERNPISPGTYASTGAMPLDSNEDTYTTTDGGRVTLEDQSPGVVDTANRELGVEEIRSVAAQVCTDPRFDQILQCRHFGPNHQVMSWREVGKRVNMSHENARKIFNSNIETIKIHLGER